VDPDRIVIAGFSDGASYALGLFLSKISCEMRRSERSMPSGVSTRERACSWTAARSKP
jgi:hypothetical protein